MKWDSRGLRMSPDQEPEVDPRRKEEQKPERFPVRLPVIETQTGQIDVLSRLLKDRILLLGQQVDDEVANILVAQLLYLAQEDKEKDITLYINSPGGSVSAGLAIYDAMQFVPCDVATVCFGMAASMGAFLLGAGAKGKRRSLPNARIMIHQPLGGAQGQAADIEIQVTDGGGETKKGGREGRGRETVWALTRSVDGKSDAHLNLSLLFLLSSYRPRRSCLSGRCSTVTSASIRGSPSTRSRRTATGTFL